MKTLKTERVEESCGDMHPEASVDHASTSGISVQYVNNQEEFSEGTFDSTVQLSVQCVENPRGLHGKIAYDEIFYPINLQPQAEPDTEDEGIIISIEDDQGE
ncbi:uncharacterized protein LOC130214336 isoform X2 [Danio aesculapii]|uniref:uncharacterized protein LOC130214336 isoform X2 n=1 Tax=Danio aesculapii TaxID=1142201 RepID=UPI0024C0A26A|nr:uncharacterized protein LOC130214336 isoform X2 [Danio aesculapii]